MSDISDNVNLIKQAANQFGLPKLAERAGVAYTTLKSFANRGWTSKNLQVVQQLHVAAEAMFAASTPRQQMNEPQPAASNTAALADNEPQSTEP